MLRKTANQLRAAATFGFLLLASPLVIGGPAGIVRNFTVDDTYYYLQIARNLADGYGSTFDRVSATNGYQLAWQGFLVPLAFVFRGRDALLEAMFIAVCALVAFAAYTLARLCASQCDNEGDRRLAAFFALGAVVLVAFSPLTGLLTGMESALTFLVLVLFARSLLALDDRDDVGGRRKALCCVFAVLLVLCRQDYVIVAGTLVASLFVIRILGRRHEPLSIVVREELRRSLPVFGAVVLGLVVSFSLYFAIDGTLVPVSGLVKLHQGVPHGLTGFLNRFLGALFPFARFWASSNTIFGLIGAAAMVVLAVFVIANRDHLRSPRLAWATITAACAFVVYCAFMSLSVGQLPAWYLAIAGYFYAIFATWMVVEVRAKLVEARRRRSSSTARLAAAGVLLLACSVLASALSERSIPGVYAARRDLGTKLAERGPASCRLAAFNAGQLGYFSGGRFINLDGLVNSNSYRLHVLEKPRRLEAFLRAKHSCLRFGGMLEAAGELSAGGRKFGLPTVARN